MSFFDRLKAYKQTMGFQREAYRNRARLILILIIFPVIILLLALLRKFYGFEGHTLALSFGFLAILGVNFGADYLTKRKFKEE